MRLYHGSYTRIKDIDLTLSESHKDFGKGFYLTDNYENAVKVARWKCKIKNLNTPEITSFDFNRTLCSSLLKIKEFNKNIKRDRIEWVKFIMANRDFTTDFSHEFDIVIGPVADNDINELIEDYKERFAEDFYTDNVLDALARKLIFFRPYIQFCFCSEESLNYLKLSYDR